MAIADPPAETIAALSLDALAAAINDDHEAVEHMARSTLDRARAAGDKLIQAKSQVPHGEWLPWLAANCPRMSERTARAYMRLARNWETLESKTATTADLTLDGALKLLAAPAEPEADPVESWLTGLLADLPYPVGSCGWERDIPPVALFLNALGWPVTTIAERLGVSVLCVASLLDPQPFNRPDLPAHTLPQNVEYLVPVVEQAQREYRLHVMAALSERRMFWYRKAADMARPFGHSAMAERFAGMAQVYEREGERTQAQIPEWRETGGNVDERDLLLIGAFIAAGCDTEHAFYGKPPECPERPVAGFIAKLWLDHFQPSVAAVVRARFGAQLEPVLGGA